METLIPFYAFMIIGNVWVAASHCATENKPLVGIIGGFWVLFGIIYGFIEGVL